MTIWQLPPFPPSQPTLGIFEDTQPWGIFFLQFNSQDIYRTALRRVLRGLVERRDRNSSLPTWEHDHLLFICTTTDFQRFAFAHFAAETRLETSPTMRLETSPTGGRGNWRRAVLSIFSWEQGDTHIRTLCEYNLPALAFPGDGFSDGKAWLKMWQAAFDVEAVTGKFFADYQRVFAQVETAVEGIPEDETEARRLYTQRLFNRLMFLRFIEKKGWLTYNGDHNYLRSLFDAANNTGAGGLERSEDTPLIRGAGGLEHSEDTSLIRGAGGLEHSEDTSLIRGAGGLEHSEDTSLIRGAGGLEHSEDTSLIRGAGGLEHSEDTSLIRGAGGLEYSEDTSLIRGAGGLEHSEDTPLIRGAGGLKHVEDFLNDRLFWAFFHGLGTAADLPHDSAEVAEVIKERRGEIPFLNGGLFEMQDYDNRNAIHIPNDAFAEILELFERYNFTVTESTPIDIEVAVDPEMLGKVFEELVTGRHDTGSYYTPRPVVSFMCRESLKICLHNKTDETSECLQAFIDDGDATEIRNPEKVLHVLQTLRICDPACGSGAYLLGMMGELLRLRDALFQSKKVDPKSTYQRKLDIIQKNLYGVDKDEFAVNIAMLRLWLSLAVDYEDDTPEPLPNLDYKVAAGDSLTGPAPEQISLASRLIDQIQEHQAAYLVTHTDTEKQRLREVIAELKESLQEWQSSDDEFVWQVEFPEVFQEGGFDIVIGNPPYVRQELIRPIKPTLKRLFPEVYAGTADLYVYFYKRGTELLRVAGVLTYISSNKFMRAAYGEKLRVFFTDKACLKKLVDFGSVQVFKAGVDTCIVLVENAVPSEQTFFVATFQDEANVSRLSDAFQERAFSMHARDLSPNGWALTSPKVLRLLEKLENIGTPLDEYVDGFYRGVVTGCNDAFIINESMRQQLVTEDAKSDELIKPLLRGRNLRRWQAVSANEYLIVIASSTNKGWPWADARSNSEAERIFERNYPAIYQHLSGYRERLIVRNDQGKFYWELRPCLYYAEFGKSKILYSEVSKSLYACYDTTGAFGLKTTYSVPTNDFSFLAMLNSTLFDWYARYKFGNFGDAWEGGGLFFFAQYMEKVPIADRTPAQKAELSRLVEQILADPQSDGVRDIEREIDALVYQLYGLTDAEIELVKQTYRDAGMEI